MCIFSNEFILKNNIEFTKSQIFPKLSVYQNYTLTKNILASLIENSKYNKKKVFLTSERKDRIINIEEIIGFFKKKTFLFLIQKKLKL